MQVTNLIFNSLESTNFLLSFLIFRCISVKSQCNDGFFLTFSAYWNKSWKKSADKIFFHIIKSARSNDRGEPCLIIAWLKKLAILLILGAVKDQPTPF